MQTIVAQEPERRLTLDGAYNVRDIGGYATTDGRITRWRTLFRGDSLHRLTASDQQTLIDHGLRTVIDLRRETERTEFPNVFATSAQVRYAHISLLPGAARDEPRTLDIIYRQIIDGAQGQLRAILSMLSEADAFPALVHCAAGKDRTGIVIALLLGLVGVPEETIAADYALSAEYLTETYLAEVRQRTVAAGHDWETYRQLLISPPELMHGALAHLSEQYGSISDYLRAIGLADPQIVALRAALVV